MPRVVKAVSFINDIAERIKTQCRRSERRLVNSSVTLRKRFVNMTDSDRFGVFNDLSNSWVEDFDTSALYSLNITTPTIRTNASAMITATVKVDAQPRFIKDTKANMAAAVARAVIEQKDRLQWTTELEERIAMEQMLGPGVFIRTKYNPYLKREHSLAQWEDVDVEMPGNAICTNCGQQSPVSGDVDESFMAQCQSCGAAAVVDQMPQNVTAPIPTGYAKFSTGDTETQIVPFFETRIDDDATQGGDVARAKWFEHHYLASLDELQVEYPESAEEIEGQVYEPSYALKWQQALKRGRTSPVDTRLESVVEQREVRDIFLTPSMYLNVEMEEDFNLKDASGKSRFSVKQGKTFADGKFQGKSFDDPPVLCFRLAGECLIDVFPCDFRDEFQYCTFLSNPSTFWGLFLTDLTILQDIINQVLTIQMYHIRRNAITSIIYNREAFDPEAFEEDLIPTKDGLPFDAEIDNLFSVVPALKMSGEPMQMLMTVFQTKQDVTLTTPALMGQAQPNEPYHAQLLQKQSSLGLLAPAEISKAGAKVGSMKYQLKCFQEYMTDEDAEMLLRANAEWDETYIEAFANCNIDSDLIVDYAEGSEVPTTLVEREIKLNKLLQDITALAPLAPQLVKPEMLNDIFAQLIEIGGIDIDVGNAESNERLADVRYDALIEKIRQQQNPQEVLQDPVFAVQPWENHAVQIEWYVDKGISEASQEAPDFALLQGINGMIQKHIQAQVQYGQMQTSAQMAVQAPMMQAQQQMAEQSAQAEQQGQVAQAQAQGQTALQLEAAKQSAQAQKVQSDQTHAAQIQQAQHGQETTHKVLDLMNKEADRQHKMKIAEMQAETAKKTAQATARKNIAVKKQKAGKK